MQFKENEIACRRLEFSAQKALNYFGAERDQNLDHLIQITNSSKIKMVCPDAPRIEKRYMVIPKGVKFELGRAFFKDQAKIRSSTVPRWGRLATFAVERF